MRVFQACWFRRQTVLEPLPRSATSRSIHNEQGGSGVKQLRGKRALVTGAASGIGRAIALSLAAEGVHLWLLDIDEAGLAVVATEAERRGVTAVTTKCDLSRPAEITLAVHALQARWKGLDILVNNAGVAYYGPTERMTAEQWQWLLSINLLAPIQFTRELLPTLLAQPESHLLNVCSVSGLIAGGRYAAYHTSKFGLVGFTEALRAEYGRRGLGVTALCPGPVQTNLYKTAISGRPNKPVPTPPDWLCSSVEIVARKAVCAIRRNQRFVLIGTLAHLLWNAKKFIPGVLDWLNHLHRKRHKADTAPVSESQRRAA